MRRGLTDVVSRRSYASLPENELLARANASRYLSGESLKAPNSSEPARPDHDDGLFQSPGRPLTPAESGEMEPRFRRDFSRVRVHTDSPEAACLGARALASGSDVAFAPGESPATRSGRALLAHELTHTLQRGPGGGTGLHMDPKKGNGGIGSAPPEEAFEVSTQRAPEDGAVLFAFDSASLNTKATTTLDRLISQYAEAVTIRIHAYASGEGAGDYNMNLSAHRAVEVKRYLESKLPKNSRVILVAHGETSVFGAAAKNRRAGVDITKGVKESAPKANPKQDEEWTIDPSGAPASKSDPLTLVPRYRPNLYPDGEVFGPKPLAPRPLYLVPPYRFKPLQPSFSASDIDWFSMQQSFTSRGLTLDTQWGDSIQSQFRYSYNWFHGFLSHDLSVKGANLALSFLLDDQLSKFAPNPLDEANRQFKLAYPDEKHFVLPVLTPDTLRGIYHLFGGKNKDKNMFRF